MISVISLISNLESSVCVSKMSQELFKARFAVRVVVNGVRLKGAILEFFPAVSANKAFRVEFVSHGSDRSPTDQLATHKTFVIRPVGLVHGHFLQEGTPKHFGHVFFFKRLFQVAKATWNIGTSIANFEVSFGHPERIV